MRVIGIDYGLKRTGVAIGETGADSAGMALPFEMFENLPDAQLAAAIAQLVRREGIETIVVGLPLNADGSVSQQSKLTERFILTLQQHVVPGGGGAEGGGGGCPFIVSASIFPAMAPKANSPATSRVCKNVSASTPLPPLKSFRIGWMDNARVDLSLGTLLSQWLTHRGRRIYLCRFHAP